MKCQYVNIKNGTTILCNRIAANEDPSNHEQNIYKYIHRGLKHKTATQVKYYNRKCLTWTVLRCKCNCIRLKIKTCCQHLFSNVCTVNMLCGFGCYRGCGGRSGRWEMMSSSSLSPFHLPVWMNRGEHKDCQNNIQAVRREGKWGHLLTNVMDKGMTHWVIVVWVVLHEENKLFNKHTKSNLIGSSGTDFGSWCCNHI